MKKKIFVISGFSGAGKDTVLNKVKQIEKKVMGDLSAFWFSRSDTTRPPRDDTDHYSFVTKDEFIKRDSKGFYLESNSYGTGHMYGTPLQPVLDADGIVIIQVDVNGMMQIKNSTALKDIPVITIFIAADAETLLYRLKNRGDNSEEIGKRLKTAASEAQRINEYDIVLVNDDVNDTTMKLWSIFSGIPVPGDIFDSTKFVQTVNEILC